MNFGGGTMKKWLSLLLMVSMVMLLAACGGGNDYEEPEEYVEDEEVIEEDELDEPETGDYGEIGSLITDTVSDDTMFYLHRGDYDYSLGKRVFMMDDVDCYDGVGVDMFNQGSSEHVRTIYGDRLWTLDGEDTGMFSVGDVPMPVLEDGDYIFSRSADSVPTMGLHEVTFYGSAIPVWEAEYDDNVFLYDVEAGEYHSGMDVTNFEVTDADGNPVDNYYALEENESYTVSWFIGTQYEEYVLKADCSFYADHSPEPVGKRIEPDYTIEGDLTKEGYATYDLSDVPAGVYWITNETDNKMGGLIEIK